MSRTNYLLELSTGVSIFLYFEQLIGKAKIESRRSSYRGKVHLVQELKKQQYCFSLKKTIYIIKTFALILASLVYVEDTNFMNSIFTPSPPPFYHLTMPKMSIVYC